MYGFSPLAAKSAVGAGEKADQTSDRMEKIRQDKDPKESTLRREQRAANPD